MADIMPSAKDVVACALPSWYPNFVNATIKSISIPLPKDFITNILADQIILPNGWSAFPDEEDEVNDEESQNLEYPEVFTDITDSIKKLGGAVFPKLNWSAPRDATWMPCGCTLKCQHPEDIYLLLKSSDFISHDLTDPFEGCRDEAVDVEYELVLRRWTDIHPASEYRCFVRNTKLIAISQRHAHECSPHTAKDEADIIERVSTFFDRRISSRFPLKDYVFDLFLGEKKRVVLLDFAPWSTLTDSFLIPWDDLNKIPDDETEVRFCHVGTPGAVRPDPLRGFSVPVDMTFMSGGNSDVMVRLLQAKMADQDLSDSTEEEEA